MPRSVSSYESSGLLAVVSGAIVHSLTGDKYNFIEINFYKKELQIITSFHTIAKHPVNTL